MWAVEYELQEPSAEGRAIDPAAAPGVVGERTHVHQDHLGLGQHDSGPDGLTDRRARGPPHASVARRDRRDGAPDSGSRPGPAHGPRRRAGTDRDELHPSASRWHGHGHAAGTCPAAHRRCSCSTTRRDCCPEPPKMMTSVSNRMALAAASSASRNVLPPKPRDAIHNATGARANKASQKACAGATCPSQHATAGMWTPKVASIQARTSPSVPSRARRGADVRRHARYTHLSGRFSNTSGAANQDPPPSGPVLIRPGRGTAPASTGPRSATTPSPSSCAAIPRRSRSSPSTASNGDRGQK